MSRTALLLTVIAVTGPAILLAQAQGGAAKPAAAAQKMTDAQKITNAMSAAPVSIAKGATIMDWPASHGGQPRQLRAGTNGWVCYPTTPSELGGAAGEDRGTAAGGARAGRHPAFGGERRALAAGGPGRRRPRDAGRSGERDGSLAACRGPRPG